MKVPPPPPPRPSALPRPARPPEGRPARAFSLIEVLVLVVVLGIVGAAAGRALQAVVRTPVLTDQSFQLETQIVSKMEDIRAKSFDSVAVGSPNATLSDIVTVGGVNYQRTVTVAYADADGNGAKRAAVQ